MATVEFGTLTIVSTIGLFVFGVAYAILVCLRPFKPTYLEVVTGVAGTGIGFSLVILDLLPGPWDWMAIAGFWTAFVITGGPMCVGQILKLEYFARMTRTYYDAKGEAMAVPDKRRAGCRTRTSAEHNQES